MPSFNRTVTVDLSIDEVTKILIDVLKLPKDTKVNFHIGHHSDPMDRFSTPFCNRVSCTYSEETEIGSQKTPHFGTSQFEDQPAGWQDR